MQGEISYDLVMEDDMSFVEGSYRVAKGDWQVFILRKDSIERTVITIGGWPSGVTGVFVRVPRFVRLNKHSVEHLLSDKLGVDNWLEVRGPDSMRLR